MRRVRLTRRYRFPAAHVLASNVLSEAENQRIFGKCANPNGHGHDYGVEVSVEGAVDPASGRVVSLEVLDGIFDSEVRGRYSHRMLNEVARFETQVPTAENIALAIFDDLASPVAKRTGARLTNVRVVETSNNHFDVRAEMREPR
jgi:6-pyruvoyltetrahydropterin/6-carboxytetrahydropterin synthase